MNESNQALLGNSNHEDYPEGMMLWGDYDGGMGLFGVLMWLFMLLYAVLLLVLMTLAVVWLVKEIQRKK